MSIDEKIGTYLNEKSKVSIELTSKRPLTFRVSTGPPHNLSFLINDVSPAKILNLCKFLGTDGYYDNTKKEFINVKDM